MRLCSMHKYTAQRVPPVTVQQADISKFPVQSIGQTITIQCHESRAHT